MKFSIDRLTELEMVNNYLVQLLTGQELLPIDLMRMGKATDADSDSDSDDAFHAFSECNWQPNEMLSSKIKKIHLKR